MKRIERPLRYKVSRTNSWKRLWRSVSREPAQLLSLYGILVNFFLLGVTAVLALFSYKQWEAVADTLNQIRAQTPAVIRSADAAKDSVEIAAASSTSSDLSTKATLAEMRRQADQMQRMADASAAGLHANTSQFIEEERPQLTLELEPNGVMYHRDVVSDQVELSVKADIHNEGKSRAIDVRASALVPNEYRPGHPYPKVADACKGRSEHYELRPPILPGRSSSLDASMYASAPAFRGRLIDPSQIPETRLLAGENRDKFVDLDIYVCVTYRSTLDGALHHSGTRAKGAIRMSAAQESAFFKKQEDPFADLSRKPRTLDEELEEMADPSLQFKVTQIPSQDDVID